jgi:hypothetical protein
MMRRPLLNFKLGKTAEKGGILNEPAKLATAGDRKSAIKNQIQDAFARRFMCRPLRGLDVF